MFQGLPVVTTTSGGLPDVVKHGENGLLVEPGDVDGLIGAIDRLLANPGLREAMENATLVRRANATTSALWRDNWWTS